jgi:uncharacterized protein YhhL (DUF1145 family)
MLFALSLLLPLLGFFFWLFWRLSPARPDPRPLRWFNLAAIVLALAVGAVTILQVRESMAAAADHTWWPVVAAFYMLAVIPLCLAFAGAIRHFLFRSNAPAKPPEPQRDLSQTRF